MARDYQGDADCECGRVVPVFKTGGGMLTSSCGWCRKQVHCPVGSKSYRDLEAVLKLGFDPDNPAPTNPPIDLAKVETPPPKKAEPPKKTAVKDTSEKTIFDIFGKKEGQTA